MYKRGNFAVTLEGRKADSAYNKPNKNPRVRINHYFTKSKEEFLSKRARCMADVVGIRNIKDFEVHDKKDIFADCKIKLNTVPIQ